MAVTLVKRGAELIGVVHVPRLAGDRHRDAEDVGRDPGALVLDVLDGDAQPGELCAQLRDAAGPVAQRHRELDEPAVHGQPALQAAAQHRGVDVAATQQQHQPGKDKQGARV